MGSIQSSSDTGVRRESTSNWEHAWRIAKDCLDVFQRPFENIEDIAKNGKEALELLAQRHVFIVVLTSNVLIRTIVNSVHAIPRFTKFTGSDNGASLEKLSALALELVVRWHEKKLQVSNSHAAYYARDLTVAQ